MTLPDGHNLL